VLIGVQDIAAVGIQKIGNRRNNAAPIRAIDQ
jgi:hypothetical protein